MDKSLSALCHALKSIFIQLKPQLNPLSFILLTGKDKQGKTALLRQSQLQHVTVETEFPVHIYYNQHGVIVELGENWLNHSKSLLQHALKHLNRCHRLVNISGVMLCVSIHDVLNTDPVALGEKGKQHAQLLQRFGQALGYPVDTTLFFTQLDAIAGFSEFFQNEHSIELVKPLGFSLHYSQQKAKFIENYQTQFDHFIEVLGQQVIAKMHASRSNIKRTLIREFPLQLATLRAAIQTFLQLISPTYIRLQALYFTSAEQGGVSLDRLNKKIQHEYALTVQDQFPQALNYRACFIEGAIEAFQLQTKKPIVQHPLFYQRTIAGLSILGGLCVVGLVYQYIKTSHHLDAASQELAIYEKLTQQDPMVALYHLNNASMRLGKASSSLIVSPTVSLLNDRLHATAQQTKQNQFIPGVLHEIEEVMADPHQSQAERYLALKTYLMLGTKEQFSQAYVLDWFKTHGPQSLPAAELTQKMKVLAQTFKQPFQPLTINQQLVTDVRNYLNALPANYFYYSLVKKHFPQTKQRLAIEGFDLTTQEIPDYFTKAGFQQIVSNLPTITQQLQADNWVLARQDLADLQSSLQKAYCYDYVLWWQNFVRSSKPMHTQNFQQAFQLLETLSQNNAFGKLIDTVQQQTSPESGEQSALFNQEIASKFTAINLMTQSTARDLSETIAELEKFVRTLSIVNDEGATSFSLIKARFQGEIVADPLSTLYTRTQQLPEPVSNWAQAIANDTWFILINDARRYLNQQWQQTVYHDYQAMISGRYPFDATQGQDVAVADFDRFFSKQGRLHEFVENYLKPFIDTSQPQWQLKELNGYVLPISADMINEFIRANVITTMFFSTAPDKSHIEFTLQKLSLDPVVSSLQLSIGETKLHDDQNSESFTRFTWPESNATLTLNSIEGNRYTLDEQGPWAFFRMLQKVNVLVDEHDSATLQILFEVNGNSGRYVLKAQNQINPFIPGILNGFTLSEAIA